MHITTTVRQIDVEIWPYPNGHGAVYRVMARLDGDLQGADVEVALTAEQADALTAFLADVNRTHSIIQPQED